MQFDVDIFTLTTIGFLHFLVMFQVVVRRIANVIFSIEACSAIALGLDLLGSFAKQVNNFDILCL
jgi:hypothetical protein